MVISKARQGKEREKWGSKPPLYYLVGGASSLQPNLDDAGVPSQLLSQPIFMLSIGSLLFSPINSSYKPASKEQVSLGIFGLLGSTQGLSLPDHGRVILGVPIKVEPELFRRPVQRLATTTSTIIIIIITMTCSRLIAPSFLPFASVLALYLAILFFFRFSPRYDFLISSSSRFRRRSASCSSLVFFLSSGSSSFLRVSRSRARPVPNDKRAMGPC